MDMNGYILECMVRVKLQEIHEATRRRALRDASRRPRWRVRLGAALVTLGQWVSSSGDLPASLEGPHSDGALLRHGASHG